MWLTPHFWSDSHLYHRCESERFRNCERVQIDQSSHFLLGHTQYPFQPSLPAIIGTNIPQTAMITQPFSAQRHTQTLACTRIRPLHIIYNIFKFHSTQLVRLCGSRVIRLCGLYAICWGHRWQNHLLKTARPSSEATVKQDEPELAEVKQYMRKGMLCREDWVAADAGGEENWKQNLQHVVDKSKFSHFFLFANIGLLVSARLILKRNCDKNDLHW